MCIFFFLSGFSFTDTDNSQGSWGREGTIFYSTLPLPSAHEYSDIYLQLCTWDDYLIFLIATLVFTGCYSMAFTTLSNYYLIDWWCNFDFCLFACWIDFRFCYSYMTWETGELELASIIILVLQANRLTKCASHSMLAELFSKCLKGSCFPTVGSLIYDLTFIQRYTKCLLSRFFNFFLFLEFLQKMFCLNLVLTYYCWNIDSFCHYYTQTTPSIPIIMVSFFVSVNKKNLCFFTWRCHMKDSKRISKNKIAGTGNLLWKLQLLKSS